ncbi:MAG: methyltransferase domain-containing protein [Candidatus Hydrogenedentes bacterium]|nr:methyltransferase domain-containing protein [Candidatus Hydrogenedentota bacterium]
MSENKRDFDKEAAAWDDNPVRVKLAEELARALCAAVPLTPDMRVLDFGCGTGLVTLRVAPRVASVTGADTSQGMLDVLTAKAAAAGWVTVFPFLIGPDGALPGETYDLVMSSMALHHVEDIPALLRALHARLAPGGRLCVIDLEPDDGQFHADPAGVFHNGFDRGALRKQLSAAGFKGVAGARVARVTKPGRDGALRTFAIFLMTGRRRAGSCA